MKIRNPVESPITPTKGVKFPATIRFVIYGDAVAKQRARVVRGKKAEDGTESKGHAFTPRETVEWEASVYGQSLSHKPPFPWPGPVALGVIFYKATPRSFSKKKTQMAEEGRVRPLGARNDYDNLIKAVKDALNKIYWRDDGHIVEYCPIDGKRPGKYYSLIPRVEILVEFLPTES